MDSGKTITDLAALSILGLESQGKRLLRMAFPRGDGPQGTVMLVDTLDAEESMSRDFRFEAGVLSDDAHIPLKAMMARMVTISLVRDDGTLRHFNGYVTEFRFERTDGGYARYRMVLEPWLAFARLRKDCVSFHGRSVMELTEETLRHYLRHDWKSRVHGEYPQLSCANQHNESDHNHLHRRWEALGLHYWYEHRADGHTLWLGDDTTLADAIDARGGTAHPHAIPFRSEAGSIEDDGVRQWQAVRRVGAGMTTLASFDYKVPRPQRATAYARNRQDAVEAHDAYENTGNYGFKDTDDGERLAQRRRDEQDAMLQYFEASGNDRSAQAGRSFRLEGHFSGEVRRAPPGEPQRDNVAARQYLILSVTHSARNNYLAGAASHYENRFLCVRKSRRWRPGRHYNSRPCPDPGVQTALVVGPPGEEIYTDGHGRVKLQFHWDRLGKFDQASSPWIRVTMPMAGRELGQIALPRVGQEVVVQFVDGNIDHPLITGVVYNGAHRPPWELPGQRALSGWRSRELKGGQRGNHLLLDDTAGELQAQLRSDHLHSQLALGHIVRVEDKAGRKEARGEGWELRTDGHGVARAARGMLLTTEARAGASGSIKEMDETALRLALAQREHDALATLARQHDAKDGGQQEDVASAIKEQNASLKGRDGGKAGSPELAAPHLVLASPAGLETTTGGSTHIASGQHAAISTGRSLSIASGEGLFASIRQTLRLFVHKAGMKLIAAAGDVDIQALSDSVNLLAKLNITHSANRITITAKEEVVINGGGSYARFSESGIEQGTTGNFVAHAAKHSLPGPKNIAVSMAMPELSDPTGEGALNLGSHPTAGGRAIAGAPYKLFKDGVLLEQGQFDEEGNLVFKHDLEAQSAYKLELANGQRYAIDPDEQVEQPRISASIGFHGYENAGGYLNDDAMSLDEDRLACNPATCGKKQAS